MFTTYLTIFVVHYANLKSRVVLSAKAETRRKQSMDINGGLEAIRGYYLSGT
jgi:hypothetical protein